MTETNNEATVVDDMEQNNTKKTEIDIHDEDDRGGNDEEEEDLSKHRISSFDAAMHLMKGNLGPGILNLPYAFAIGGWLLGPVLFFVVAFQGLYSMWLLVYCKLLLREGQAAGDKVSSFGDVAHAAFGSIGANWVNFFVFVLQIGVCSIFLSLVSTNLGAEAPMLSSSICEVIVTVALLIIVLLRRLKDLKWISAGANILILTAIFTAIGAAIEQFVR